MNELLNVLPGFNLWRDNWIRVLDHDGNLTEISIEECLCRAADFHALCDPSPLVVGGTHRLLVAILQWIEAPDDLTDLVTLLDIGYFAADKITRFGDQYGERFELFHQTRPFLQASDVPLDKVVKPKRGSTVASTDTLLFSKGSGITAATRLLPERPGGTNRTLFWHIREDRYHLCPACCARALVVIPAFARSEGGGPEGYTYSINGSPPIYLLPIGANLFESLALSLITEPFRPVADEARFDIAPWTDLFTIHHKHQVASVGYFEGLTFPARRIRLLPQYRTDECSLCGESSNVVVAQLFYQNGHRLPKESSFWWQDPFVAYRQPREGAKKQQPSGITLKAGQALWRDYQNLLRLHDDSDHTRSKYAALWLQQLGSLINDEQRFPATEQLRVRCVGMRVSRDAKIFEWVDEALEAPAGLLRDERSLYTVGEMIGRADACKDVLIKVFNDHFMAKRGLVAKKQTDREASVRFKTARARMLTLYWERLAWPFRDQVRKSGNREERQQITSTWTDIVLTTAGQVFDEIVEQLGERGELLRVRVQAQVACTVDLAKKRKEWMQ